MADTVVQELVINTLTQAQFDAAKESGTLSPYELYGTPDTSVRLPVLTPMWFDHVANDISWLRADTFSWQSGDVYVAAYEHLADDYDSSDFEEAVWGYNEGRHIDVYTKTGNPQIGTTVYDTDIGEEVGTVSALGDDYIDVAVYGGTERFYRARSFDKMSHSDTIGDITIRYALGTDGHKICLPNQESNIVALYEKIGAADYYILDTTNKQFKLPRKQKRTLIQAVKNDDNTWCNLYSDGWVEQGGRGQTNVSVTLPIAMADSNYVVLVENHVRVNGGTGASDMTTTSFIPRWQQHNANAWGSGNFAVSWQVSGYATESAYASAGMRLEYYYVGNFEQSAIEQTAGLNTELFNGKADVDLSNINASQSAKETIVGWGMPDYSAGVVVANNYVTTFPCYAVARNPSNAFNQTGVSIYVDDIRVFSSSNGNQNVNKTFCAVCYVGAGHTVSYSGDGTIEMTIYPLIGAN